GRPTDEIVDQVLAELRLINRSEMERLFPDSHLWVERTLGWPKSYTAFRLPRAHASQQAMGERLSPRFRRAA
ncbi:MAG TPA: hypothetical protein VEC99_13040, partial [Clostridia bacterium]|nr:hypothetical protein [Clostridia bacterium]